MKDKETEHPAFVIDNRYWCKSCGSHTHRCDYTTGCCYECGADDWEPEPDKLTELGI